MRWYFLQLPFLCAATAVLELDAYYVGQWMLSRPLVLGPLLGAYLGKFGAGVWVGGTLELLTLDDLPIGHYVPLNAAVATASTLFLCCGSPRVALPAALPAGIFLGFLFRKVDASVRSRSQRLVIRANLTVERGESLSGRLIARGIGSHAAAVASFLYAAVAAAGPALAGGWELVPQRVQAGLDMALQAAPWLGIATLAHVFRPR